MSALFAWLLACTLTSQTAPPMATIGERVVFPSTEFLVMEVKDRGPTLPTTDGGDSVTTAGRYVDVRYSVKNNTATATSSPFAPLMVDSQGRTYGALPVGIAQFYVRRDDNEFRWHEIAPGQELEFRTIYDIDHADAANLHLEVNGNGIDEHRSISLGL